MSERRNKALSILLNKRGKTAVKIELYPAEQWPEQGGTEGHYRLRVGGRWHGGKKFTFYSLAGLLARLDKDLRQALGLGRKRQPCPDLPRGTAVRVPNGNQVGDQPLYDVTRTATLPFQGVDGQWYVVVALWGKGHIHVPVAQVLRKE
jgi:hypothetical protein